MNNIKTFPPYCAYWQYVCQAYILDFYFNVFNAGIPYTHPFFGRNHITSFLSDTPIQQLTVHIIRIANTVF